MKTTVSSRGQTAVPAEVRKRFRLDDRSKLEWLIDGDLISVLPLPAEPVRAFRGSLKGVYSGAKLLRERRQERRREQGRG